MSMDKPKDPLSSLLAELPKVRDDGFTERVLYRVQLRRLRRHVFLFTAWCCGLAGIILSLPLETLVAPLLNLLQDSNTTWVNFTNINQLTQVLSGLGQTSNLNGVLALSACAILLVVATFSLMRD